MEVTWGGGEVPDRVQGKRDAQGSRKQTISLERQGQVYLEKLNAEREKARGGEQGDGPQVAEIGSLQRQPCPGCSLLRKCSSP